MPLRPSVGKSRPAVAVRGVEVQGCRYPNGKVQPNVSPPTTQTTRTRSDDEADAGEHLLYSHVPGQRAAALRHLHDQREGRHVHAAAARALHQPRDHVPADAVLCEAEDEPTHGHEPQAQHARVEAALALADRGAEGRRDDLRERVAVHCMGLVSASPSVRPLFMK